MGDKSAIQWTDATWNPVAGCSMVSAGCTNCYAMREAHRLAAMGSEKYEGLTVVQGGRPVWNGTVRLWEKNLKLPLKWKTPKRIFVNSMSDLFHESVSDEAITKIFAVMAWAGQHTFQVLTKRPARMLEFMSRLGKSIAPLEAAAREIGLTFKFKSEGKEYSLLPWPIPNVWLGVSAEDQPTFDERVGFLRRTPAAVRWVSLEPLLGPIDTRATDGDGLPMLNWVVAGGESGLNARPFNLKWARDIVSQCKAAGIPCFVKQLGKNPEEPIASCPSRAMGLGLRDKKGGDWNEWPEDLRVREYPKVR